MAEKIYEREFQGYIMQQYQYFESIELESKKQLHSGWEMGNRLSNNTNTNSAKNVDRNMSCNTIAHV